MPLGQDQDQAGAADQSELIEVDREAEGEVEPAGLPRNTSTKPPTPQEAKVSVSLCPESPADQQAEASTQDKDRVMEGEPVPNPHQANNIFTQQDLVNYAAMQGREYAQHNLDAQMADFAETMLGENRDAAQENWKASERERLQNNVDLPRGGNF